MPATLVEIITAADTELRNTPLEAVCRPATLSDLISQCEQLESFRRTSRNLYDRVRALFFLYAIHRFHLPLKAGMTARGFVPFDGYEQLLKRRFEEAIALFLEAQRVNGPNDAISSALASAYHGLAFQTLADQ